VICPFRFKAVIQQQIHSPFVEKIYSAKVSSIDSQSHIQSLFDRFSTSYTLQTTKMAQSKMFSCSLLLFSGSISSVHDSLAARAGGAAPFQKLQKKPANANRKSTIVIEKVQNGLAHDTKGTSKCTERTPFCKLYIMMKDDAMDKHHDWFWKKWQFEGKVLGKEKVYGQELWNVWPAGDAHMTLVEIANMGKSDVRNEILLRNGQSENDFTNMVKHALIKFGKAMGDEGLELKNPEKIDERWRLDFGPFIGRAFKFDLDKVKWPMAEFRSTVYRYLGSAKAPPPPTDDKSPAQCFDKEGSHVFNIPGFSFGLGKRDFHVSMMQWNVLLDVSKHWTATALKHKIRKGGPFKAQETIAMPTYCGIPVTASTIKECKDFVDHVKNELQPQMDWTRAFDEGWTGFQKGGRDIRVVIGLQADKEGAEVKQ